MIDLDPPKIRYGLYAFLIALCLHAPIVLVAFAGRKPPAVPPPAHPVEQVGSPHYPTPVAMPLNASHQERLEIQSGLRRR